MTGYRIALRPDLDTGNPMSHDTLLDDIVVNDVPMFRAEDMGDHWWVCCYLDNETHDRICWSVRARKKGVIEWTTTEYPASVTYEHDNPDPGRCPHCGLTFADCSANLTTKATA